MSKPPDRPAATRVGRNALIIATAAAFVRLSGLARDVVFAAVFGAGMATDAYNAAFRAAQFFRELLAEGSLSNLYVPIFADTAEKDGLQAAWRLANVFLGLLLVLLGAITLATFIFADGWVWVVASGFSEDPEKFQLASLLTRVMAPFVATVSLASVFMGMLNVRGKFFLPAVAPAAFNVAVIAACLLKGPFEAWSGQEGILLVAIASVVGGMGQFLVQLPALWRDGFKLRPRLANHPALKKLIVFAIPAFIAVITVQFNLLVEMQLASRFGDGPVSYLQYAYRFVQLPTSIVAGAVGTAALASLSTLAAMGRKEQLSQQLGEAVVLNSFLVIPASAGLFFLAQPIVALMYERGEFDAAATAATASALRMYALAVWGICSHRVLVPCYYAIGRPWFAMGAAVGTMILKLPVALALVYPIAALSWPGLGFEGLPLSHGVLVTGEVAILLWGLGARAGGLPRSIYKAHIKILMATVVMVVMIRLLEPWAHGVLLLPVVGLCGGGYFLAAQLLRMDEARRVLERFRIIKPRGLPETIDPVTRQALSDMQGARLGSMELADGSLRVRTDRGTWRVAARAGVLTAEQVGSGAGDGEPLAIKVIMRIGQGPPMMHGLALGARCFRADGDRVVEAQAAGPAIPVR